MIFVRIGHHIVKTKRGVGRIRLRPKPDKIADPHRLLLPPRVAASARLLRKRIAVTSQYLVILPPIARAVKLRIEPLVMPRLGVMPGQGGDKRQAVALGGRHLAGKLAEGRKPVVLRGRVVIDRARRELEDVRKQRATQRKEREKMQTPHAAIVGDSNAGKSTLLNRLSGADVLAKDMLFATLDTTTRKIDLPDGQPLLLTDTVGFVRNLPHRLVEAFKATLEEAVQAVDYEIDRRGRAASASARDDAPWRYAPPPPELVARLRSKARATTHGEALRLAVWEAVTDRPDRGTAARPAVSTSR